MGVCRRAGYNTILSPIGHRASSLPYSLEHNFPCYSSPEMAPHYPLLDVIFLPDQSEDRKILSDHGTAASSTASKSYTHVVP